MPSLGFSLILDLLIAVMLAVTIVYAMILNRRLHNIRDSRADLEKLSAQFIAATANADKSVQALKKVAEDTGKTLQQKIDIGQNMIDEMTYIVKKADELADILTGELTGSKKAPAPQQAAPVVTPAAARNLADTLRDLEHIAEAAEASGQKAKKKTAATPAADDDNDALRKALKGLR